MANPVFITDDDLWVRAGGRDKLTQLIDPEKTGAWDATISATARQDACNKVIAAAGLQAELETDVTTFRDHYPHLVTLAAQLALGLVWDYGTSGQARPANIESLVTTAETDLVAIRERRLKTGTVSFRPNAAQFIEAGISLNANRDEPRLTLSNWRRSIC